MIDNGAISRAKLQSNRHHQQTNIQFFTGWMPFLSPNQQCQGTEGKQGTITLIVKKNISWHLPASTASLWYPSGWNEYSSESESESKQSCGLKSLSPWPLSLVNDLVKKSVCLMSSKPLKILKTSIKSPRSLLLSSVVIPSFLVVLHTGVLALFLYSSTRSSLLHLL